MAIGLLIALLVVGSSVWVSHDAAKYDWDGWAHPRHPEWHSGGESPATWFFVCVTLWPFLFPGYFWDRKYARRRQSTEVVTMWRP